MELPEFPKVTATDMTLVLGAESYIDQKQSVFNDPWGKDCLRDFVDLVLNSEKMYFTLPGKKNKGVPSLIAELSASKMLHKLPDAAIRLTPEIEENVFNGFLDLVTKKSKTRFWDWVAFQVVNPIVAEGHRIRIGSMSPDQDHYVPFDSMISSDGYNTWKVNLDRVSDIGVLERVPFIKAPRYLSSYFQKTKYKFDSQNEFLLCYAFDVYRRGWQYMSRVSAADIGATYFPHEIRDDALEASTNKWEILRGNQKMLWSWGDYIVYLLDEYKIERSPQRVAERIIKIQEAMKQTNCPKWFNIGTFEYDDSFKELIQQTLDKTARKAKLPVLRMREDPQAVELITAIIEIAFDFVVSPLLSIGKGMRVIIKTISPDLVGRLEMNVENQSRNAIRMFHKGAFGYPGLMLGGGNR
ncbi:MAG: hypothetical protein JXA33_02250 [Anaerolineae bacterium]|nr:hypothetical protein [Anaerolineae bacterium]